MKKKIIIIVSVLLFLFLTIVYVGPFFVNMEEKKKAFADTVKTITGNELVIESELSYSPFPFPKISAQNVKLKNSEGGLSEYMVEANSLEICLPIFGIFSGYSSVNNVKLSNAKINLENFSDSRPNWVNLASGDNYLKKITLYDAEIIYLSGKKDKLTGRILKVQEGSLKQGGSNGPFDLSGKIIGAVTGGEILEVTVEVDDLSEDSPEFDISAKKENFLAEISGQISGQQDARSANGKIEFESKGISISPAKLFGLKNIIQGIDISKKIALEGDLQLTGDMKYENGKFLIENLNFSSGEQMSGKGRVVLIAEKIPSIEAEINFESLNLKTSASDQIPLGTAENKAMFLEGQVEGGQKNGEQSGDKNRSGFSLPTDFDLLLNLKANKFVFDGQNIEKAGLEISLKEGELEARSRFAGLAGESEAEIQFNAIDEKNDQDEIRQKIDIAAKISGKNALPASELFGLPVSYLNEDIFKQNYLIDFVITFSDSKSHVKRLKMDFGDTSVLGQVIMAGDNKIVSAAFQFDKLDLDKLIKHEVAVKTEEKEELSTQQKVYDKITKLREAVSAYDKLLLVISGKELFYKNRKFQSFSITTQVQKGIFDVKNFSFATDTGKISGNLRIDDKDLQPELVANIAIDKTDAGYLLWLLYPDLKEGIKELYNKKIDLSVISAFSGEFNLNIGELDASDVVIKDIKVSSKFDADHININKITASIFDGELEAESKIAYSAVPLSASVVYKLNNGDLGQVVSNILSLNNTEGRISLTGGLLIKGTTLGEIIKGFKTEGNIATRGAKVTGASIFSVPTEMALATSLAGAKQGISRALSSGSTIFDYVPAKYSFENNIFVMKDIKFSNQLLQESVFNFALDRGKQEINLWSDMNVIYGKSTIPVKVRIGGPVSAPEIIWNNEELESIWQTSRAKVVR